MPDGFLKTARWPIGNARQFCEKCPIRVFKIAPLRDATGRGVTTLHHPDHRYNVLPDHRYNMLPDHKYNIPQRLTTPRSQQYATENYQKYCRVIYITINWVTYISLL